MQINAPLWDSLVFYGIDDVEVEAVTAAFGTVEVLARGHAGGASCPDCGRFSGRVHDRYQRRLRDLPLADQGFVIRLTVRRFICESTDCPRRTFAEPFSRLAVPHARFTTRLCAVQYSAGAGNGRLRDPSRSDLLHRADQRRRPSRGRCAPDAGSRAAGRLAGSLLRRGDHLPGRDVPAPTPRAPDAAPPTLCRSPTAFTCGRAWARPWRPASPPTATACAPRRPTARCLRTPHWLPNGRRTTQIPSVGGPSARRQHTPRATHAGRPPGTGVGASTPSSGM
ncbi:transposase family protein [Streptomyces sp. NPDC050842]|uniref:transposase family protein n=1 Tax=Streptomyces sp. NPDC050842 TaxID=3365636 RepID=UPI0037AC3A2A